jgi:hypothetical protein
MFIGSVIAGKVKDTYSEGTTTDWLSVWMVPAGISAVVLILFIFFFTDNKRSAAKDG